MAGDLDVLIAEQIEDKSELHYVGAFGGHIPITEYDTIGRGRPYGSLFLDLLWKPDMTMKQVAELGYFVIALVERHFLDATIGIGDDRPQVFFIPDHHRVIRLASEAQLDSMRKSKTKRLERWSRVESIPGYGPESMTDEPPLMQTIRERIESWIKEEGMTYAILDDPKAHFNIKVIVAPDANTNLNIVMGKNSKNGVVVATRANFTADQQRKIRRHTKQEQEDFLYDLRTTL